MSRQVPIITSMEESAEEERRRRTRQYLLTMAIRTVCVAMLIFVRGPWMFVVAAGAIFLPWIAVVIANHVHVRKKRVVRRPDEAAVVRYSEPVNADQWYASTNAKSKQRTSADGADSGTQAGQGRREDEFR